MDLEYLRDEINKLLLNFELYADKIKQDKLYKYIIYSLLDKELKKIVEQNFDTIYYTCCKYRSIYSIFIILALKTSGIEKEKCQKYLDGITPEINEKTKIFIMKQYLYLRNNGCKDCGQLFPNIMKNLEKYDSEVATRILVDLYTFNDFNEHFKMNKPLVSKLINSYFEFYENLNGNNIRYGANVLSILTHNGNEDVLELSLLKAFGIESIDSENFEMIGCGGSSMVFKIKDKVLKLSETRTNRKIFINHRILISEFRKLFCNPKTGEQFYAEIMQYIKTGDITKEEVEELTADLYQMGINWHDHKTTNCGVLPYDYDNVYEGEIDYSEVAGVIEVPTRREAFAKRKRRVVVLDSDDMTRNTYKTSG